MDRSELKLKLMEYAAKGYEVPRMDMIKTPEQIEGIRKAGKVNSAVLDAVEKNIKVGMTTDDINTLVYATTLQLKAIHACLN